MCFAFELSGDCEDEVVDASFRLQYSADPSLTEFSN